MAKPVIAMCVYRVKAGAEEKFRGLLVRHWTTLRSLGLAAPEPPVTYQGVEKAGQPLIVEFLAWRDESAPETAHQSPEVMALWEPMGALCEERGGRPAMEFPHVERLEIHGSR